MLHLDHFHRDFNWVGIHSKRLQKENAWGVLWVLGNLMKNDTRTTIPVSAQEIADELGIAARTVQRHIALLESLDVVTVLHGPGKNRYVLHDSPPGEVLPMRPIGQDPDDGDDDERRPRRRERRVPLGGTDAVDPQPPPKRKPRDTPSGLATFFLDQVVTRHQLDPSYHFSRGALMHAFKAMLEEQTADHVRRMIRQFSYDLESRPLREGFQAWRSFLSRRHELARSTVTKQESEIDYATEAQTDPLLFKLMEKKSG